jgi:sarcosine oxidase subunit gamma
MLNYNSPIKEKINYTDLIIQEVEPIIKINLRGNKREFLTAVDKTLGLILPNEPNTSTSSEKLTALWLSPDEWIIISNDIVQKENNIFELEELLNNNIHKKKIGSVVNVTDHFVMVNLEGDKVYEILATACPFNFDKFKKEKDSVVQTIFAHIDVIIHHKENNNLNLLVRRSFSQHLFSWMNDSASRI